MTMEGAMEGRATRTTMDGARRRWTARGTMDGARRWPSADEGCVFRRSPAPSACGATRPEENGTYLVRARRASFLWIGRSVPPRRKDVVSSTSLVPDFHEGFVCRVTTDGLGTTRRASTPGRHFRRFEDVRRVAPRTGRRRRVVSPRRVVVSPSRRRSRAGASPWPPPRIASRARVRVRVRRAPRDRPRTPPHQHHSRAPRGDVCGGMPLADQPGMAQGFGDLTAHDFLRVAVDAPGVRVLNIDPPVLTVDDFLTHDECDALVDAARASGEMKVSAVGGAENVNIRTSRTCTLNSRNSPTTRPSAPYSPPPRDSSRTSADSPRANTRSRYPRAARRSRTNCPRWRTTAAANISRRTRTPSSRRRRAQGIPTKGDGARVPQRRRRGRRDAVR